MSILLFNLFSIASFFVYEYIANSNVYDDLPELYCDDLAEMRLLVVAPHNDDEAIGATVLMKKVLDAGGKVQVVLMSNGDGFTRAAWTHGKKVSLNAQDYIDFGYIRQQETIESMAKIGLAQADIVFLGYPDGGISKLWDSHWSADAPLYNKRTKTAFSPYHNSYEAHAIYSGDNVVKNLKEIITSYQPNCIVMPHPGDAHSDHWATNAFMQYTLTDLDYPPTKTLLYLAHQGEWPLPLRLNPGLYLVPPSSLLEAGTDWYAYLLNEEEQDLKKEVLLSYRSQAKVMLPYLYAFVRKNELFGVYDAIPLPQGDAMIAPFIDTDVDESPYLLIQDAVGAFLYLHMHKYEDIINLYGFYGAEGDLHFYLCSKGKMRKEINYCVDVILFTKEGQAQRISISYQNGQVQFRGDDSLLKSMPTVGKVGDSQRILYYRIPIKDLARYDTIMLDGETWAGRRRADKTPWRVITLEQQ